MPFKKDGAGQAYRVEHVGQNIHCEAPPLSDDRARKADHPAYQETTRCSTTLLLQPADLSGARRQRPAQGSRHTEAKQRGRQCANKLSPIFVKRSAARSSHAIIRTTRKHASSTTA